LVLGPRGVSDDALAEAPEGVQRQLLAAARALMPPPPTPGEVGSTEGLKSRRVVDTAGGIVWVVSELSGYGQEFVDEGYRLETWSFFNDNGQAQQGRLITPLIFKKEGDAHLLTGIGTTRTNAGSGLQAFPFDAVEGSDAVGAGHYFGWHTGDLAGKQNAGVVEFEDGPRDRMTILTLDGQLSNQRIVVGSAYRKHSEFPRTYSIRAVSRRK
jgi:hypothetical protein